MLETLSAGCVVLIYGKLAEYPMGGYSAGPSPHLAQLLLSIRGREPLLEIPNVIL